MTTPRATDAVLVGALRAPSRAPSLLTALAALPPAQQLVLRASYLEGRAVEEIAAELDLTVVELAELRTAALRALARAGAHSGAQRGSVERGPDTRASAFTT